MEVEVGGMEVQVGEVSLYVRPMYGGVSALGYRLMIGRVVGRQEMGQLPPP